MRKNVKQQFALRVLSTAALMAMVSSIATAAFADTYDLTKGSVTVETKANGITYVTQKDDKQVDGFARNKNNEVLNEHPDDTGVTITSDGKQTSNTITVETAKDQTTDVTLEDVFINREGARNSDAEAALTVKGDGDTNIELNGSNTLSSTGAHAGLEKTDAECSGTLTITDDKNDNGSDNNGSEKKKDKYGYSTGGDTGTLAVIGGGSGGAGIGGQGGPHDDSRAQEIHDASNITITGGNISAGHTPEGCDYNAHWNPGAGIGGGSHGGDGTNITITGNANVDAYGSYYAAGIGGADYYSKKAEDGNWYTLGGNGENITISGNAKVTAQGGDASGIGGGEYGAGKNIQIKDHADVHAYSGGQGAGIGGGRCCGGEVSISDNATVVAKGENGGSGIGSGCYDGNPVPSNRIDTTVTISDNANVTAVGDALSAAIGNGYKYNNIGKTDITITGGTITAISGSTYTHDDWLPSAIGGSAQDEYGNPVQNVTVTINGTTGNTTINASCVNNIESAISKGNGTADIIGYDTDGVSPFGEDHSVVVRMYKKGALTLKDWDQNTHRYKSIDYNHGELYQTVHNRKYMEEHPEIVDPNKLKDGDLHDWQPDPDGKYKAPTLEEDGYVDCICSIDKCGQTKRVVLPKLTPEPSEPDVPGDNTPNTPNKPDTPKQPDGTTPAPVTPDAPAQDGTAPADTPAADTTADAAVVPADAQNVVQDAKPEAAAAASTTAPTAAAAVLPQTGANWLAVVGTALSGLFLLAAGFVLDRKNRRMN